jgi:protein phosphatase methylesterase 1
MLLVIMQADTCRYRVVAMDQRHHGLTVADTDPGDEPDFSKDTLRRDAAAVWEAMFGDEKPPTVLLGHSFGGAIAVWTAKDFPMPSLEGLIVVDVVEGTAIGVPHCHSPPVRAHDFSFLPLLRFRCKAYT